MRGRGPAPDPEGYEPEQDHTNDHVPLDRLKRRRHVAVHRPPPWLSATTLSGTGDRSTFFKTSSFGPNDWTLPSLIARTWSTPSSAFGRCAMTITIPPRRRTLRMASLKASSPS